MEKELEDLLVSFPQLEANLRINRIRCKLSGHELPLRIEAVKAYVNGKKFQELKDNEELDVNGLAPFIIPSVLKKGQMFCCLTSCYINRKPKQVKNHVSGLKYKYAKAKYDLGEKELSSEPLPKAKASKEDRERKRNRKRVDARSKESPEEQMEVDVKEEGQVCEEPYEEKPSSRPKKQKNKHTATKGDKRKKSVEDSSQRTIQSSDKDDEPMELSAPVKRSRKRVNPEVSNKIEVDSTDEVKVDLVPDKKHKLSASTIHKSIMKKKKLLLTRKLRKIGRMRNK